MTYEFYWEHTKDGGVRLLRGFGQMAEVSLPGEIEGHPVTEIGAYCFAGSAHLPEIYNSTIYSDSSGEEASSEAFSMEQNISGELRELAGKSLERLVLPDSVKKIGNFAFYQCSALTEISLGNGVREVGGDAFMNCHRLHDMTVRGGSKVAAGIRQILAQISHDMEVTFMCDDEVEARLLFPEYYESYDEIAPAHLFGRNIEGEGFRARQCVREGVVDFKLYDTIFPKACAEEKEQTLCALAMNRLRYPAELGKAERNLYEAYISDHADAVCAGAVRERDEETVWFLCEQKLMTAQNLELCIRLASEADWVKGAAGFLRAKEQFFAPKPVAERYVFDEF